MLTQKAFNSDSGLDAFVLPAWKSLSVTIEALQQAQALKEELRVVDHGILDRQQLSDGKGRKEGPPARPSVSSLNKKSEKRKWPGVP